LYAVDGDEEIIGVLPLVHLKSRLFGDYIISVPYFNYGGAAGISPEVETALMTKALSIAKKLNTEHVEFRDFRPRDSQRDGSKGDFGSVRTDKITMILDLPATEDELWKKLGAKRRSQINRPLREGVEVKTGHAELLEDFYSVFARNMRDLGTPVYSQSFFSEILHTFSDKTQIVTIYHQGRPVGGAFLIGFRDQLEIPWASTLRSVNSLGVNMLMYWEVLKYAISNSYKTFDFGRCSVNSGTYRFKKQWGAQPKQLYWYYWLSSGEEIPQLNHNNPKYKMAIAVWQRLPLFFTNWLGPKIVKNLP
jgi:FemAB-related protein (PEP-CTERM system-associated)